MHMSRILDMSMRRMCIEPEGGRLTLDDLLEGLHQVVLVERLQEQRPQHLPLGLVADKDHSLAAAAARGQPGDEVLADSELGRQGNRLNGKKLRQHIPEFPSCSAAEVG